MVNREHALQNLNDSHELAKKFRLSDINMDEINIKQKTSLKTLGDFFGTIKSETYIGLKSQTDQARKEWDRNF